MIPTLILALAPGIALAAYIYSKNEFARDPLPLLALCFICGGLGIIPAGAVEFLAEVFHFALGSDLIAVALKAFLVTALPEEAIKYFLLRYLAYPQAEFNEPFDGIVYAVVIGMGFASAENLIYVWFGGIPVALIRMFTAIPAHGVFAVLMGYFVGLAKFRPNAKHLRVLGLGAAVLFHGTFDFSVFIDHYPFLALASPFCMLIGILLSMKAIEQHRARSPFRP